MFLLQPPPFVLSCCYLYVRVSSNNGPSESHRSNNPYWNPNVAASLDTRIGDGRNSDNTTHLLVPDSSNPSPIDIAHNQYSFTFGPQSSNSPMGHLSQSSGIVNSGSVNALSESATDRPGVG